MATFSREPISFTTAINLDHAYFAASGMFRQLKEIERYACYGTGKGGYDLIDYEYGHTKCCNEKFSTDFSLLRHYRSVEHGVGLVAKDAYGETPYVPPGEWRYSTPTYMRFSNSYAWALAKKIAKFAAKNQIAPVFNEKLSDEKYRQKLALDLAQAYIDHLTTPKAKK